MDPLIPIPAALPIVNALPITSAQPNNIILIPGIFSSYDEENDYLSSLDSDTRDYVIKHSNEFSSRTELIDCVNKLHGDI